MRGIPLRQTDFTGGLNTKSAPYLVEANECRDCSNVVTTVRGSIKKRDGCTTFCSNFTALNAGSTQIHALFGAYGVPTAGDVLIAIDEDGEVYSVSTVGTATDINTAVFTGTPLDTAIIQAGTGTAGSVGPIYFNNPTAAYRWIGTGTIATWVATSGTVPTGSYMVYFKNRVWIAGNTTNPSRLFFSDIGNPGVWPAANVVDFDPTDGDSITGIGTAGPYLLVFKKQKTWVVYDLDTGANRVLSSQLGCAAYRSITETPIGTFFLSQDKGVWVTDGKSLKNISIKIDPTLDGIVAAQRKRACGGFINDHYYLSICTTGTTNNLTLDYDTTTSSWWKHTNTANQFALWRPATDQELFSAIPTAARVDKCYVIDQLQDNGANYTVQWTGPWLSVSGVYRHRYLQEPYRNKRIREIHVDGAGTVDAYISKDFGLSSTLILTDIFFYTGTVNTYGGSGTSGVEGFFGGNATQAARRLYTLGVCRVFSFQIQSTSINPFEMDAYTPYITPRNN
jgi:hypothetical protein